MTEKGVLYIVSTPIGNLEDITFRAIRILKDSSLIAAEDTRRSKVLLSHYNISTPCKNYYILIFGKEKLLKFNVNLTRILMKKRESQYTCLISIPFF